MQKYKITPLDSRRHYIGVELYFEAEEDNPILQVSVWRPGRYEGGYFVRNFIGLEVVNAGEAVETRKVNGQQWEVRAKKGTELKVSYTLYAKELSAGNTYWDRHVLLINPVNALVYVSGSEHLPAEVHLELPEDWEAATALPPLEGKAGRAFRARDVQHLMDTPILAAGTLKHLAYEVEGVDFYLDIYGEMTLEPEQVIAHFRAFSQKQIESFGGFPVQSYRFLFLFMPYRIHHGVEHEDSTVIVLGPAEELAKPERYTEFLGVSSHELYHTWNVKHFRPAEWTPYDFSKESPSRLGYVVEGVTTYMGDKMLWQAGVFDDKDFAHELAVHFKRHMHGRGRFNLSLADASIDTWVDGYGRGTPDRRVSIYAEGAMFAFVLDVEILLASEGRADLSAVMRSLYKTVDPKKGYTEDAFWEAVADAAPVDLSKLRKELVDGRGLLEGCFRAALAKVGLEIAEKDTPSNLKSVFGLHLEEVAGRVVVWNIAPDSPADAGDLNHDDVILEINEADAKTYLETDHAFSPASLRIAYQSGFRHMREMLQPDDMSHFREYEIQAVDKRNHKWFETWKKLR